MDVLMTKAHERPVLIVHISLQDCMEEINLFSENKSHLKQLGEQLLLASDKAKEAEIHGALQDVNDRWQHLFDHIETRWAKNKWAKLNCGE